MDLGAFLRPGAQAAVLLTPASEGEAAGPAVPGRLVRRGARLSWLCAAPEPPGRRLSLTLDLPGFSLDQEGDLCPAGPSDTAAVVLLAEVRGCRPWGREYALRLSLLGRIWP
jgi:hypothetical protein